jgi:type VI protein secretion system component VasK
VKRVKREVLWLIMAVLAVDAVFLAVYLVGHIDGSTNLTKIIFTALWTLVTLAVVIRGLARVRSVRFRQTP